MKYVKESPRNNRRKILTNNPFVIGGSRRLHSLTGNTRVRKEPSSDHAVRDPGNREPFGQVVPFPATLSHSPVPGPKGLR